MEGALNGPLSFMGHEEMFTFSQKTNPVHLLTDYGMYCRRL